MLCRSAMIWSAAHENLSRRHRRSGAEAVAQLLRSHTQLLRPATGGQQPADNTQADLRATIVDLMRTAGSRPLYYEELIAAAMGAVAEYPEKNLIIIDMGTAITAELVSKNKEFLGGVIMPGLKISVDALAGGTANLTSVEIVRPEHVYGSSTTEAIQAGLYYGTAGAVKEFCNLFKKNVFHGEDTIILGTGGFARTFEDYRLFDKIIPGLVLSGVKVALDLN